MKRTILLTVAVLMAVVLLAACGKKTEGDMTGAMADSVFDADTTDPTAGDTKPTEGQSDTTDPTAGQTDSTKPTESQTDSTKPTESQTDPTKPTEGDTKPTEPTPTTPTDKVDVDAVTYEQFQSMTGAEQQAFAAEFETPEAFFTWLNAKKEAYEKENPAIEVGGNGSVNMEDIIK